MVTMLHPVSIRQLKLEKVEEEIQKPDESYESPFRPCGLFISLENWKPNCWILLSKSDLAEIAAPWAAAGVRK